MTDLKAKIRAPLVRSADAVNANYRALWAKPIGSTAVTDEAMLAVALHLRGQEISCATSLPGS